MREIARKHSGATISMTRPNRILRLKSVLERTGLSRSTLYRKIQKGSFPAQLRISERCIGWRENGIERWLSNPMYYSRADAGPAPLGSG
jgi:prophage regulatory protein